MTENQSPQETSPSPAEQPAKTEVKNSKPAKKETLMTENKKPPVDLFKEAMQSINVQLAEFAGALEVVKTKKDVQVDENTVVTRDAYSWVLKGKDVAKARAEMKAALVAAWQSGAYNYEQIARALRIDDISIRALLDEEFIENNGL